MINGETTDPSNPFDPKSDGDASTASPPSRYSSFGESEYERYCSANSIMGTPSMCSSVTVFNDFPELDFGSVRSLGFGEQGGAVESFNLGGRIDRSSIREDRRLSSSGRVGIRKEDGIRGRPGTRYGSSGLEMYGNEDDDIGVGGDSNELMSWKIEKSGPPGLMEGSELKCGSDNSEEEDEEGAGVSRGVVGKDSVLDSKEVGSGSWLGLELEERCFDGELEREEGTLSRNEYSEDEGSMYNYGTDDEPKTEFDHQRRGECSEQLKQKNGNENSFLMNSSVAFGSDDWDDFVQGSAQTNTNLFTKSVFPDRMELNVETDRKVPDTASVASYQGTSQREQGEDVTDIPRGSAHVEADNNLAEDVKSFRETAKSPKLSEPEGVEEVKDIPLASYQVQAIDDLTEVTKSTFTTPTGFQNVQEPKQEDSKDIVLTKNKVPGTEASANYPKVSVFANFSKIQLDSEAKEPPPKKGFNIMVDEKSDVLRCINTEVTGTESPDDGQDLGNKSLGKIKVKLDPLSEISTDQLSIPSTGPPGSMKAEFFEEHKPNTPTFNFEKNMRKNTAVSEDLFEEYPMSLKTDTCELNEFYDEFVNDMEEILLDSTESPGARFSHGNRNLQAQLSLPLRDGGSTASTSGTDDAYLFNQHSLRIDGVEVVGARQKKGDVSFSERLVGVKEYTVYKMRVWSGNDQWEIERRYRDFFTLYRRMKTLFADHGWNLPSPWSAVEKESRKIFGNASPDVIAERSVLIQECLQSILHYKFFSSPPSALIWFLSPQDSFPSSNTPDSVDGRADTENVSTLGKTISLIVEVRPYKSLKQMLEGQHYMCAGCHKHFDDGKTLIRDFAQTFGWGKPRLCEYTGQLFCSSCHANEIVVIPARVLHHWDFTQYSVSQLAKSYLDSIHDQPMLCVSAVNPFLFSKVPALLQVMGVRKKIGAVLPFVRCPFRRSINKGLGSRKYLLESNDFFALRDLIDLSKGAFAVLPVMVETVLSKILGHITEQCLICCDVGVPCGARQACNDPSCLIFPFQEDEIDRCPSCESVFHKCCFRKLTNCPCGEQLRADEPAELIRRASSLLGREVSGVFDLFGKGTGSGLLSGLFSKVKTDNPREHKDGDNVLLMGSFPPASL